jgi:hypothetical protein
MHGAMIDREDGVLARSVATADDVAGLSAHDRALISRWLADSTRCDDFVVLRGRRRVGLAVTIGGALLLIPWMTQLWATLPDHHSSHQWRLAWSGFDVALVLAFALAAFTGWRRRQISIPALIVVGVLLCCDAWFDVTLSWGTSEQAVSILTALFAELPVAIVVFALAHGLLRETMHFVWHLEGRDDPVPPLRRLPIVFVPADAG